MDVTSLLWLLVLAAGGWLLYAVGRRYARKYAGLARRREQSGEELLRERYARGDIDRDTYERLLLDLWRGPAG